MRGICSTSDDPSSKEDISYHQPLRKIIKEWPLIHQARTYIFGALLSTALFMYHFVNTECMTIVLGDHELPVWACRRKNVINEGVRVMAGLENG